jgi:hypothetical protein
MPFQTANNIKKTNISVIFDHKSVVRSGGDVKKLGVNIQNTTKRL